MAENQEEKAYPFRGYPKFEENDDGNLVEVRVSPRISVKANGKGGIRPVSIYVDGAEWTQCTFLALRKTGQKLAEMNEAISKSHGSGIPMDVYIEEAGFSEMESDENVEEGFVPVETIIFGHASSLIGWIENDFDLGAIASPVSFGLIDYLVGSRKANELRYRYISQNVLCGHPSVLMNVREKHSDMFSDVITHLSESDRNDVASKMVDFIPAINARTSMMRQMVDVFLMLDPLESTWKAFLSAMFDLKSMNATIASEIMTGKSGMAFLSWIPTITDEKKRQIGERILQKSERHTGEKERVAENLAVGVFKVEKSSVDMHYSRLFDRAFDVNTAIDFVNFARDFGSSEETKSKFKTYIYLNIDEAKKSKEFLKHVADMLNVVGNMIDPSVFSQMIELGVEIEQCAQRNSQTQYESTFDGGYENSAIIKNPNGISLPLSIPNQVMVNSRANRGHYDPSLPWEFDLGHSTSYETLVSMFKQIAGRNQWAWHSQFQTVFGTRSCSSHLHFSPVRRDEVDAWTNLWNNLVVILPLTAPFWIFGQRPRQNALSRWASPVVDRFTPEDVAKVFGGGVVRGTSGHNYQASHQSDIISWNKNQKENVTIEFRLNESHPYWSIRCVDAINSALISTMGIGSSILIENQNAVLERIYELLRTEDVYVAMIKSPPIKFIVRPAALKKDTYANALEFFVDFCTCYSAIQTNVNTKKVLEVFSLLVDFDKVDTDSIWDVGEVHRMLFDDAGAESNRKALLHELSAR